MQYTAKAKMLRVSPRKLRLVANLIKNNRIGKALDTLRFNEKRWSRPLFKVVQNAMNNAAQDKAVNVDKLFVKKITVDKGPTYKRFTTRARGSSSQILKRTSNVTVVLEQKV